MTLAKQPPAAVSHVEGRGSECYARTRRYRVTLSCPCCTFHACAEWDPHSGQPRRYAHWQRRSLARKWRKDKGRRGARPIAEKSPAYDPSTEPLAGMRRAYDRHVCMLGARLLSEAPPGQPLRFESAKDDGWVVLRPHVFALPPPLRLDDPEAFYRMPDPLRYERHTIVAPDGARLAVYLPSGVTWGPEHEAPLLAALRKCGL